MTVEQALAARHKSTEALAEVLRGLPHGQPRKDGLRAAHEAGVGATELAQLLGVSRQRIYELLR